MIKIIAVLDNAIGEGGGFDQSLNSIVQMQRLSSNRFAFEVFTTQVSNVDFLKRLGINCVVVKLSIFDRFLVRFSQNIFWQALQWQIRLVGAFEKKLISHGCDVVYFLTPSYLPSVLQKLNYINTVWDLSHRETPEFPEVRSFNAFFIREKIYKYSSGCALLTLTDSQRLADMVSRYYGVDPNRLIVMPFSPTPFIQQIHAAKPEDVVKKYNLDADYFYYPAQFWAHKNHIRILQSLMILRDKYSYKPSVVFSGKDHGNLGYIKKFIKENELNSQVKILGFVPSEDMRGLYESARAVTMPTYFGPTNLPPLEAWSLGVPLIYSAQLAEQAGNAALLVDPDSADELADAMLLCGNSEVRDQLILAGYQRILEFTNQRAGAEKELCVLLEKFSARRECWE